MTDKQKLFEYIKDLEIAFPKLKQLINSVDEQRNSLVIMELLCDVRGLWFKIDHHLSHAAAKKEKA